MKKKLNLKRKKLVKGGPIKPEGGEDVFNSSMNEGQTMFNPETKWYQDWVTNPEYASRMEKNFKPSGSGDFMKGVGLGDVAKEYNIKENQRGIAKQIQSVNTQLPRIKTLYNRNPEQNNTLLSRYKAGFSRDPEAMKAIGKAVNSEHQGWTDPEGNVVITNNANEMYGPGSVKVHEDTHATGLGDLFKGKFKAPSTTDPEALKEFRRGEQYPYLMQMRYDQGFKPGEEITPERLKQIKDSGYKNHLFKYYSDDEILKYLNTLASNSSNNGETQYAAYGGPIKKGLYNQQRADELGYKPDATGHLPSVDSETGMWLKSKEHPTAWMELAEYTLNPELQKEFKHPVINQEGYFGDNQLQYLSKKADGGTMARFKKPLSRGGKIKLGGGNTIPLQGLGAPNVAPALDTPTISPYLYSMPDSNSMGGMDQWAPNEASEKTSGKFGGAQLSAAMSSDKLVNQGFEAVEQGIMKTMDVDPRAAAVLNKNQDRFKSFGTAGRTFGSALDAGRAITGKTKKDLLQVRNQVQAERRMLNEPYLESSNVRMTPQLMSIGGQMDNVTEYDGLSHEEGGMPVGQSNYEVEGNEVGHKPKGSNTTNVLSDRIKAIGSKHTFAELGKKVNRDYTVMNNRGKRVDFRPNDSFSTKARDMRLKALFDRQEVQKADEYESMAKLKHGGKIKMAGGGPYRPLEESDVYGNYDAFARVGQLAGPLALGVMAATNNDRVRLEKYSPTLIDENTAPNIAAMEMRSGATATNRAIRDNSSTQGQFLGNRIANGISTGRDIGRTKATLKAQLQMQNVGIKNDAQKAATETVNNQAMLEQQRRDNIRKSYLTSIDKFGERAGGIAHDYNRDRVDLMKLNMLGTEDFVLAVDNSTGKIVRVAKKDLNN